MTSPGRDWLTKTRLQETVSEGVAQLLRDRPDNPIKALSDFLLKAAPKVVIVTGASRGLGRGIALTLAKEEGCRVYATGRNEENLKKLAEEASTGDKGGVIIPIVLDQKDDKAVKAFADKVSADEGKVDLLVNNAFQGLVGMTPWFGKQFWERPASVYDDSMNIGTRSAFVMSSFIAPVMVRNKSGLMVQVSSGGGIKYLFDVGYGVGKAALDRMTADMGCELKEHGVNAITLYPGGAVTENAAFPGGETPVFTGRAVASLLNKATSAELAKLNGKVINTAELCITYNFTDVDGKLPEGPYSSVEAAKGMRELLGKALPQYNLEADLDDWKWTNNEGMGGAFHGYKADAPAFTPTNTGSAKPGDKKVCIVTGASRGLGRGIALTLAKEGGCTVYATGRNEANLKKLAEEAGGGIIPSVLDQKDDNAVKAFAEMVMGKEGKVDLLVNNAFQGLVAMTPHFGKNFWDKPTSVYDDSMNIGTRSAFVMSSFIAPIMVKNKSGMILQVSSGGGIKYLFDVGYGVGKAALDRMSADMACELKEHGVNTVTLYPGGAVTENAAFPGGETPVFTGRAVVALLNKATPAELAKLNGKVINTAELCVTYNFTDANGKLPEGPYSSVDAAKGMRELLGKPVPQYNIDSELDDWKWTNNEGMGGAFHGYK